MALLNKVLEVHETNSEVIELLADISVTSPSTIFTFDDGLYSNWKHIQDLINLPNKKIFYISTGITNPDNKPDQNPEVVHCADAHKLYFNDSNLGKVNYMNWNQIRALAKLDNCFIGMHGHMHINPNNYKSFNDKIPAYKKDIREMLDIFERELPGIEYWKYFQYPYNAFDPMYSSILEIELINRNLCKSETFFSRDKIQKIEQ